MRLVLFVIIVSISVMLNAQEDSKGYIVNIGDTIPEFEMGLINGDKVKTSDFKGKVIMLQFTASWCSVCRKEMPFIEDEIWQKLKNRNDFALYGIDRDEPLEKVMRFSEKMGITYPLALDPNAEIFGLFALKEAGITRNVIIDKEGKIAYLTRLFNKDEFDAMKRVIFELIDN